MPSFCEIFVKVWEKWQNNGMLFIAKIKPLQGAENLPYKEYHPHQQNAIQAKFEPLQSMPKQKATHKPQHRTQNTNGEPPKIALEPPNVPPHISERQRKKKKPSRAKKRPARHKEKPPEKIPNG